MCSSEAHTLSVRVANHLDFVGVVFEGQLPVGSFNLWFGR